MKDTPLLDVKEFEKFLYLKKGRSTGGVLTALNQWHAIEGWFLAKKLELNAVNVEMYFNEKQRAGLKNGSLIGYLTAVHLVEAFTGLTLTKGIRLAKPVRELPTILTPEEVQKLLDAKLPLGWYNGYSLENIERTYQTLTAFLYWTGCRVGEALSLKVKDMQGNMVIFRMTKNATERQVYLSPDRYEQIKALARGKNGDDYVFRNSKGKKIHGVDFRKNLKRRAKEAGITKDVYPHLLRHTLASHLAQNNTDVRVTQKILGHKKLDSTIYYEQFNSDKQVEALNNLKHEKKEDLYDKMIRIEQKLDTLLSRLV